jgi:hypothetical protein
MKLSEDSVTLARDLSEQQCPDFHAAVTDAATQMDAVKADETAFLNTLQAHYGRLGAAFLSCLRANPDMEKHVQNFLASYLVVVTGTQADLDNAQTPLLGAEYDLNTPASQPSYSSLKANFSWNPIKSTAARQSSNAANLASKGETVAAHAAAEQATVALPLASTATRNALTLQTPAAPKMPPVTTAASGQDKAAKDAAKDSTPPVTINASLSFDLYNGKPPSGVPGTERLRDFQTGAEIDFQVPTSKIRGIGGLIGDSTLAGSYYYQDQTSPGIVTGPPSSITIVGLPSTAKTVYTSKGPINLGQVRWGLGTGSNLSFPICFTYSNRSELISHPIKGFQFGLSYNLSALFTRGSSGGGAAAGGGGSQ